MLFMFITNVFYFTMNHPGARLVIAFVIADYNSSFTEVPNKHGVEEY